MPTLSYDHKASEQTLVGRTIGEHFDVIANTNAHKEALVSVKQKLCLSYAELKEKIDLLARGLIRLGIAKGDRVGIWSTNNAEWVITQFATAKIGAILVNINPAYKTTELEYALRQSGVKLLITMPGYKGNEYLAMLAQLVPHLVQLKELNKELNIEATSFSPPLPDLAHIAIINGQLTKQTTEICNFDYLFALGHKVSDMELSERMSNLQFDDVINIQYTSGTTGFPKGAALTHHNLLNNALYSAYAMGMTANSRFCIPLPMYHCAGMVLGTLAALGVGGAVVLPNPSFDAQETLKAIATEKCTHVSGVPTMFIALLSQHNFSEYDLSSLSGGFMAGAPCPVELMRQVINRLHCPNLVIFYGQTECSPVITSTTIEDSPEIRATTVGKVIPHLELKIIDQTTGKIVARGVQGEICARGYAVMPGYWLNKEATIEAIDQAGWLHTGDLGVMNKAGYVHITGRKKDMIIRGGENIYPRELEEMLHTHPAVAQAQIFGVPDQYFGEEIALWLQLKQDCVIEEDELKIWLKERIAHFKVPRYVKIVSDFPMTVTGKVRKHVMREIMISELSLETIISIQTA